MMNVEYEAKFLDIDKDETRKKLQDLKATLIQTETKFQIANFLFPEGHDIRGGYIRVRDEGNKITMTIKVVDGENIEDQKERELKVDNMNEAICFLEEIGCKQKSSQEKLRESWELDGAEVVIDTWPFINPVVEVEGDSEEHVKQVSEKLGFDYENHAQFGTATTFYARIFNVDEKLVNRSDILFDQPNPFVK